MRTRVSPRAHILYTEYMKFSWKNRVVLGIAVFAIAAAFHVTAQEALTPQEMMVDAAGLPSADDIDVQLSPENPKPFSPVVIRLTSNLVDVSRYTITWWVDGKSVTSGIGMRSFQVTTKNYNQSTRVQASIDLPTGTVVREVVVTPGDMTMLWEAVDAYVPPFYPGKKLPSSESLIRFTALPNFGGSNALADAKTGVYRWERNGNVVPEASGYGKSSFLIAQNRVRTDESVTVAATDQGGTTSATGNTTVPIFSPHILFYEKNAATGLRSTAARNSFLLSADSMMVIAEPYYFSTANGNPNQLGFEWSMNDQPIAISNTQNPQTLELKRPASSGRAAIAVAIKNPARLLQTARNVLTVTFMNP